MHLPAALVQGLAQRHAGAAQHMVCTVGPQPVLHKREHGKAHAATEFDRLWPFSQAGNLGHAQTLLQLLRHRIGVHARPIAGLPHRRHDDRKLVDANARQFGNTGGHGAQPLHKRLHQSVHPATAARNFKVLVTINFHQQQGVPVVVLSITLRPLPTLQCNQHLIEQLLHRMPVEQLGHAVVLLQMQDAVFRF